MTVFYCLEEKPFSFSGAGQPVFGAKFKPDTKNSPNKSRTESDGEEGGAEEYDPHYDPIVPLPEAIIVSTGEEGETAMFNERAKVYRFDDGTKEWKERGVGQMKILFHPVNRKRGLNLAINAIFSMFFFCFSYVSVVITA